MLPNQCFALTNLVPKGQVRFISGVKCLSKEKQQTFNKVCFNTEGIRCIATAVRFKPVEWIKKDDSLLKNFYAGSYFSSDRTIHISPTSYQRTNQDDEKRKNYIFIGSIALMVVLYIILSLSIEKHADHVIVR